MSAEIPPERATGAAWVLHGGQLDLDALLANHARVRTAYSIHGLCATTWHGSVPSDGAPYIRSRNSVFHYALTQELRTAGFDVIREPGKDWPDSLIVLPGRPTKVIRDTLYDVFFVRELEDNPNSWTQTRRVRR